MQFLLVLQLSLSFNLCLISLYILIFPVQMGASDFCMHPTDYVLALAESGSNQETLSYFATCNGVNPSANFVSDAEYNINVMRYFVSYLGTSSCPEYDYLTDRVDSILDRVNTNFIDITSLASCDTYVPYWNSFFHDGVCGYAFDGMYMIWITQTLCAICLLVAAMCASSIFPYFLVLKKMYFASEMMSSHGKGSSCLSSEEEISSLSSRTAGRPPFTMVPWEVEVQENSV